MRIEVHHNFDNPLREELTRGLIAFNDRNGPPENWRHIGFYAFDEQDTLCGGLVGDFEWDWLRVSHLWVKTPRQGLGARLMAEAVAAARARGSSGLYLDTMGFQARGFYEKMGFEMFGAIEGAAGPHARYFMKKRLDGGEAKNS
jgi:GNAT superfamily N-acetyltransferase